MDFIPRVVNTQIHKCEPHNGAREVIRNSSFHWINVNFDLLAAPAQSPCFSLYTHFRVICIFCAEISALSPKWKVNSTYWLWRRSDLKQTERRISFSGTLLTVMKMMEILRLLHSHSWNLWMLNWRGFSESSPAYEQVTQIQTAWFWGFMVVCLWESPLQSQ